jgi:RNA-directed DNA polymerase
MSWRSTPLAESVNEIWRCLWRWAKRRHPNKSSRWVRQKYFRIVGFQHWVFGTETGNTLSTGKPELLMLYDIAGTPIRRHRKLKAAANPFDVQWESYFEERLGFAMLDSLKGRVRLIRLWLDQRRSCPVCRQMITKTSGWRLYHVERTVDGGKDTNRNLVMLHPECHRTARALGTRQTVRGEEWSLKTGATMDNQPPAKRKGPLKSR